MSFIRVASSRLSGDGEVIGYPEGLSEGERNPVEVRGVELERINAGGEYNIYKLPEGRPLLVTALTRSGVDRRIDEFRQEVGNPGLSPIYLYTGSKRPVYLGIYERGGDGSNKGRMKRVRIEPVGVVVIGIDGLRQDVLYDSTEESVKEEGANYYIEPGTLSGLGEIMKPESTVKVREVSAVFPSITLASWASIFTGKPPKDTGILGNEFYARDLNISVPQRYNKPAGIISFGNGAFRGYDDILPLASDFFMPYQFNWEDAVDPLYLIDGDMGNPRSPQNICSILKTDTLFEYITGSKCREDNHGMLDVKRYFNERGGDPVVVANSHYARGGYWLTWDIPWGDMLGGTSKMMDASGWDKLDDYLSGRYRGGFLGLSGRNEVPFSALTVWYLSGLDHTAHEKGMDVYRDYFINNTDMYIKRLVDKLKELDEFDNKIFIITSDHGHTATADTDADCKLRLEGFDNDKIKIPETKSNNNLHIWELGNLLGVINQGQGLRDKGIVYKLLVPEEISASYESTIRDEAYRPTAEVSGNNGANVIAALNGPMVHIYFRDGDNWSNPPTDNNKLGLLAEVFRVMMQVDSAPEAEKWFKLKKADYKRLIKNNIERLHLSIDKILIRIGGEYKVFNGLREEGSPDTTPLEQADLSNYVDGKNRIEEMNERNRSGDLILLMKFNTDGVVEQRYTTGVSCKSWHGSLNRSDSYVPFIVAYPGGNKHELKEILKDAGVCDTEEQSCQVQGNWELLPAIVKKVIERQYK